MLPAATELPVIVPDSILAERNRLARVMRLDVPDEVTTRIKSPEAIDVTAVNADSFMLIIYILHHLGVMLTPRVVYVTFDNPDGNTGKSLPLNETCELAPDGIPPESVYISIVSQSM